MRNRLWALVLMLSLAAMPAWAQETRGNINGTVEDAQGVIPGATVRITNTDNSQTQQLITNGSGYFEAPLLPAGQYQVTVEMPSFKTSVQRVTLSVSQSLTLKLTLEVGQVSERVDVTATAPLLDTTSVSSGQNYDRALIEGLPMASNQPILLAKFAQGIVSPTTQQLVLQGQIDGPNDGAGTPTGGVGSFNYTIDGATNSGNSRRMAASPNSDMVQEMRVETSNFDAAQGHGTGASISLMTRAGSNSVRGTVNYLYWTGRLNSWTPQQRATFTLPAGRPETGKLYNSGHSHSIAFTGGGPVVIPKVIDGRGKLFVFGNFQLNKDDSRARNTGTITVAANQKHLNGDFSDLLTLPSGAGATTPAGHSQYQIFDPLTVRLDPIRAGAVIRDPFVGNIIPENRYKNADGWYKNQMFALWRDMQPKPNQNFIEQGQIPTGNDYQGGVPNITGATNSGIRLDYNASESDRFFFRASGTTFHEQLGDWTYESADKYHGMHFNDKTRMSWSYTGNWTKVSGSTVIDSQLATNRFFEDQQRRGLHKFTPADVGLPSYLTDFCKALDQCMMPTISVGGYQGISTGANGGVQSTNIQGQSNITAVKGSHTLRGGADLRLARLETNLIAAGNVSGTYSFDNTYTRAADTTTVFPASSLGLSIASLMLGLPTSASIGVNAPSYTSNPYYSGFFQDTWRVNRNLTLNFGLRYEYENGIKEKNNAWILGFDPNATLAITQLAQEAYARNPQPQVAVADFKVRGGMQYATAPGARTRTWEGESMWMPRFSGAYKLGEKNVIKGGWGLFFDTLNAADYGTGNQTGYTSSTSNVVSTNFGQTWLLGDPKNGISPLTDPFPVRLNGSRFEPNLGDTLGIDTLVGSGLSVENPNRQHARVQRWRIGLQREIVRNMAVEIAYSGMYADRNGMNINQQFIPESYYSTNITSRDQAPQTLLQQNVTNPFNIANFASLATSNPVLYQRMAATAFFTAANVQRQTLMRAYPQFSSATFNNLPLGVVKSHGLEVTVNRRYSAGLSANVAFSATRVTENRTVETYDRVPTLWQTNNSARPWKLAGGAVYELPFGVGKAFANSGGFVGKIVGGWQTGGTVEFQPGSLLNWNNLFFYGNLGDIAKDNPEIALQWDGSLDMTKTWFNTDAGFEKITGNMPANFQKRSFPFRVDGVRSTTQFLVNMNFVRNFDLGSRRTYQFRVDMQNILNNVNWGGPNTDPTSTNFGRITTNSNSIMRFVTFVSKISF